jgi:hypothetical protein
MNSNSSLFLVGQNSRGNWVVRGQGGRCGGLFVGRAEALKFALSENGNHPEAVIELADGLELDMTATAHWPSRQNGRAGRRQQAA